MSIAGTYEVLSKHGGRVGSFSHSTEVNNEEAAREAAEQRAKTVVLNDGGPVKVVYRDAEGKLISAKTRTFKYNRATQQFE